MSRPSHGDLRQVLGVQMVILNVVDLLLDAGFFRSDEVRAPELPLERVDALFARV